MGTQNKGRGIHGAGTCTELFIFWKPIFYFQLAVKLNEPDDKGYLTLDLALSTGQEDLALNLIEHKVRVNQLDSNGSSPLHNAITRGILLFPALNHMSKPILQTRYKPCKN